MRLILGGVALLLLGALNACGSDSDVTPDSRPSGVATCSLLTASDRADVAGTRVDTQVAISDPPGFGDSCQWVARSSTVAVSVTSATSVEWLEKLPGLLDGIEATETMSSSDKNEFDATRKLVENNTVISPDGACDLFVKMAEIGGSPKGANYSLNIGSRGDHDVVTAQMCERGRFTVLVLGKASIERTEEMQSVLLTTLRAAHERAVAAGR